MKVYISKMIDKSLNQMAFLKIYVTYLYNN